jgi:manganese/zinc/iron transport system substrate-binding protein
MVQKAFFGASKNGRHFGLGRHIAVVGLLVLGCLAGCSPGAANGKSNPSPASTRVFKVVATTTMVADLVRQVAGDHATVECLLGVGVDPHSYKATPRDSERLLAADLVVSAGLHLEGRLADLIGKLENRVPVIAVGDRLPKDRLLDADAGLHDPHVWFDADLWSLLPHEVAAGLATIDPAHADGYHERAEAYATRLRGLDASLRDRIATIPESRRVLVTAHDAFRYFGRAYGIEVVGVQGTSTTAEAGLADVNRLVDLIVSRKIPAVFVETSVADRNVQAVIEGAAAQGHTVRLGGRLYSDSLGDTESGHETLEAALMANVETIVDGLAEETGP